VTPYNAQHEEDICNLVRGGQGHTAEDLRYSAAVFAVSGLTLIAVLGIRFLVWLVTGV